MFLSLFRECKQLENRQELRGNVSLLVTQGQAHYWAGDDEQVCLFACYSGTSSLLGWR